MSIKLTKDFNSKEFICYCGCGLSAMDFGFMRILQKIRDEYGKPMIITDKGGIRCFNANLKCGGAKASYHLKGRAADIACNSSGDRLILVRIALKHGIGGIGIGKTFLHVDDRPPAVGNLWHYY